MSNNELNLMSVRSTQILSGAVDGTKRDSAAIEERRLAGARLLQCGVSQGEVARKLAVSRQTVSVWARQLAGADGAVDMLRSRPRGRPTRLDDKQCRLLSSLLHNGARAAGFPGENWTVKRVRMLIEREFGIAYSNSGSWELLRKLGFTRHKPPKQG
ncbi:winged helix-turn-helix domain-containing protein [Burkholderia ambifaria]|uniref:winged helix-turn-helix domain-containing protein n=1 Tax=Burkholderia ambifaria TaxID=152480 RepID=UPI001FC867E9|nr:winged helix-turn-helix domain-containing protein [Burkholderia ambifaria]